jgi:hypothetical protein
LKRRAGVVFWVLLFALLVGWLNSQVSSQSVRTKPLRLSFWNGDTKGIDEAGEDSPAELGVKFTSDSAGEIVGIRFYKFSGNTGTHIANVWSSAGDLLGSATFKNETSSGWQEAKLDSAIPMRENTIYVVSYHSMRGYYAFTKAFFAKPFDAEPLHAPAQAGVFAYGSSSRFPTQSFENANYWVDPIVRTTPIERSARTVALEWKPSTTPNVTYTVYRRTSPSGDYVRIVSELKATTYTDHLVVAKGQKLYYAVTCVDEKHRESAYSNETQVTGP